MSVVASAAGMKTRPKAVTLNVRERTRDTLSALNLHWAGTGLLALVNLYLLLQMGLAWQQVKNHDADALARQQVALKTAEIASRPLQGLDVKLAGANTHADGFYQERLPGSYSEVLSELGGLAKRQSVRLTRVQYAEAPVAGEAAGQLREVKMDASLSGDYRALVVFLNGLERDRVFFLISGVTLTGQQTGTVNLRIRLTTYLRGLGTGEEILKSVAGETGLNEEAPVASAVVVSAPEASAGATAGGVR